MTEYILKYLCHTRYLAGNFSHSYRLHTLVAHCDSVWLDHWAGRGSFLSSEWWSFFKRWLTPKIKVLVIEDQPINSFVTRKFLQTRGHVADEVQTGYAGLIKFKSNPGKYHLILLDISLPDSNGIEIAKQIRQWEQTRGISKEDAVTIVALSTYMNPEIWSDCLDVGMQAAFHKPITQDLIDRIIKICRNK